ncbi:MAG: hypothetical protein A2445_05250 [Candidatus Jacksonbacteria bacterium RIFOXYC2_FULL_44_29]|nr:MAG: hypothetical protein UW45_C0014G0038 [Parcubacteria group bacterium GW2011_GWC2_44_22]OGY75750.1 MAG: hypothetical protein A2240_06395 [Candidatus Jacksonbacteria bacterium RIFOXYA2_FULL_43_12]OGY76315.1 MAG: hypothetical protein A2295_00880 [Candidatus Jacksonbacteria bacterium RIFOXYB2_FULL_44_15]OGY78142.1 MAG: hypothetical protein A2445_05250 [Candidatus Jacksonbacteria bacterium RIFOXYC2_FULL_44_29]OGY80950.1 MAG: hypothetical protein A2550_02795 [Candidatus Jacksonbacteria bacteri
MYLSGGYDLGSSSVKFTIVDLETGQVVASATSPCDGSSMGISSPHSGWAEQNPTLWWDNIKKATAMVAQTVDLKEVQSIGLAYQMHGLVSVNEKVQVLRPAIIWCDSRATLYGDGIAKKLGAEYCLTNLRNISPGNFTASKLAWVRDNEPLIYKQIARFMLPGDYVALRMTGNCYTTRSGLSEMMLCDFENQQLAVPVLDGFGIDATLVPSLVPTFGRQGALRADIASELGFSTRAEVCYRAGDQPNNAFSLKVLNPGEVAVTAGTSGVVFAVGEAAQADQFGRVNTFLHVNDYQGVLMCINGCGSLFSWLQKYKPYSFMDYEAGKISIGSDGLYMLPYGNGAERTLKNANLGATINGLDFNRHGLSHTCRAALESIAFAFKYGMNIMSNDMKMSLNTVRAGKANMFKSAVFAQIFADVTGCVVEVFNTDGSVGAALAAGVGYGYFSTIDNAFTNLKPVAVYEPIAENSRTYETVYGSWLELLNKML